MQEYVKIQTIFKRDPQTKKLIDNEFTDATVEYLKDNKWVFTEKVDGTNIRIHWDGYNIEFGGRTDKAEIPGHLLKRLNELFGGEANAQLFEQNFADKDVILYGEGYGIKIQNGGGYRDDVDFVLFDVQINGNWMTRENVETIAASLGCSVVPVLFEGTLQEGIDYVKQHNITQIGYNGAYMEGVVARPKFELLDRTGHRIIVKIKYKDFL